MIVGADIRNLPRDFGDSDKDKYIVARRCEDEDEVSLWYYGIYETKQRANEVAAEIRNGVVLRVI